MAIVLVLLSVFFILLILRDGFEAMVLPRRVTHSFRLTVLYYRMTWLLWRAVARRLPPSRRRNTFLSAFGPLSMLGLFSTWVVGLIVGFGLLNWSLETPLNAPADLFTYLYLSGVTFFTLGYSDVTPGGTVGRVLSVLEAGVGFGFLAVIIGYLPVLYAAFSRRELTIGLLDARAGSPPNAANLLLRLAQARDVSAAEPLLAEWERWAGETLESHLSFPVLTYYRSQHDNQSWLAALVTILDTSALLLTAVRGSDPYQTQLTFAAARHTAVDLAQMFRTRLRTPDPDRLPPDRLDQLRGMLGAAGLPVREGAAVDARLIELRGTYEPFLEAMAEHFLLLMPPVLADKTTPDNWQTSAYARRTAGIGRLPVEDGDDHLD
jgi:hypothetical protein